MNAAKLVEYMRRELSAYYPENEGNAILFRLFDGILGYEQADIVLNAESDIADLDFKKFKKAVKDLKEKKPVQYILGYSDFGNVRIRVDHRVLIPRPETEELVNWIVESSDRGAIRILDVGTGSGCIAISLKKELPNSQVMGTDVDEECIDLAKDNATNNKVQINFRVSNALDVDQSVHLVQPDTLDLIVSNPPYIQFKDRYQMDENILSYEPAKALFVDDDDPMLFYKSISNMGATLLKPGGVLYFEINEKFGNDVEEVMNKSGYTQIEQRRDIHDKVRFVRGVK
ncbi:MAG: peptide chain release factor N(5)-glutamine methyltransferase [Flavobacteriales bacterium]|nr:peptide chain release factor N(5)-glutamine methyltransferase [Flavobacteriales bacterium]